jgi:hypothetical protein
VKQELRYWPAVRRQETHHLTDAAICDLPLLRLLVEVFQPTEFIIEQRADPREPGHRPDLGAEPREISARHHELSQNFATADELSHAAGFTHGTILPPALSAARVHQSASAESLSTPVSHGHGVSRKAGGSIGFGEHPILLARSLRNDRWLFPAAPSTPPESC